VNRTAGQILWVIPNIDPRSGGPSSTAVNGAIAEARSGLGVTMLYTDSPGEERVLNQPAVARMEAAGVRVVSFSRSLRHEKAGTWGLSLPLALWILRHARKFDAIHIQYVWAATTVLGVLAGRIAGTPVVVTPHESLTTYDIDFTSGSRIKRGAKLTLRSLVLRGIDVVAFSSELERRDSPLPAGKGVVIAHAVAERTVESPPGEPEGTGITLGFLGRFHPKKNLADILRALSLLEADRYRLIVAGGGPPDTEKRLEVLVDELGLGGRVEWRGQVDVEARQEFFNDLHVLVMPSHYECFGMVAAESMAAGIPAIVSRETGIGDLIREYGAGIVIDRVSPEDLTVAIREFAEDRARHAELREQSLKLVNDRLTFDAYAASTGSLYSSLSRR